jgi:transcriptional regulator with XRE-family HTH domain
VEKRLPLPVLKEKIYETLGRLVADRRKGAGLSQKALADSLGLSRASITNIERGKQPVQLHLIFKIANVLRVDVRELIPTLDDQIDSIQVKDWLNRIQGPPSNFAR